MNRYVLLNAQNQILTRISWDGVATYTPPAGTTLMLEADALALGYAPVPVPPVPDARIEVTARHVLRLLRRKGLISLADVQQLLTEIRNGQAGG